MDPTFNKGKSEQTNFYYELIENGSAYYLLGVDFDNLSFTKGDVLPQVDMKEAMGFRIKISP